MQVVKTLRDPDEDIEYFIQDIGSRMENSVIPTIPQDKRIIGKRT